MLQESRYKERAKSHAYALGPMQIIPRTGRLIADEIDFPRRGFQEDQLYETGVALRQAAWYLAALKDEFSNTILAMAAYNGGPIRIAQHVRNMGPVPFDVLVEEIGAHETRNYARKIVDHFVRYLIYYADAKTRKHLLEDLRPLDVLPRPKGKVLF